MEKNVDNFLTKAYEKELSGLPQKIRRLKVYSEKSGDHFIYFSFDYKKYELTCGLIAGKTAITKKRIIEVMDAKKEEFEKMSKRINNSQNNKEVNREKCDYLINYAVKKCAIELDYHGGGLLTIEGELEERVIELSKQPLENFKDAAEEISKRLIEL